MRYEQIGYLRTTLEIEDLKPVTSIKLGDICNLKPQIITKALKKFSEKRNPIDRKKKLTPEQEETVVQHICEMCNNHMPLSPREILEFCSKTFNMHFSDGWLQKFVERHSDQIQRDTSYPQEDRRLCVTKEQCYQYLDIIKNEVNGKFAELIFNADETGSSEWMDKKNRNVIVPKHEEDVRITHKVRRASKLQTMLGCISAAGDVLTPVLIHSRKTVDNEVYSKGLREGTDVILRYSETGYITSSIFEEWIEHFFVTFVNDTRNSLNLQNEEAVLFLDGCSSHTSGKVKQILAANKIKMITFPPHASHIFQMLDLVTFGVLKHAKYTIKTPFKNNSQAHNIHKYLKAFEISTISSNNRAAFLRAGFIFDTSIFPYKIKIDENQIQEIIEGSNLISEEEFQQQFPKARRKEFGFINKEFF